VISVDALLPARPEHLSQAARNTMDWNVVAAGALVAAIPTAIMFFAFQKHFVSGLLVGSNK